MMAVPDTFVDNVQRVFGDRGREWLKRLPGIVAHCRRTWGLQDIHRCEAMSFNYIEFAATATGEAVALKVGVPHPELFTEIAALRLYAGRGTVCLLEADPDKGAFLMQRAQPGTMLWELGDNATETDIAVEVMQHLSPSVPPDHGFPLFRDWVERAFRLTRTTWDPQERMPRVLLDKAETALDAIRYIMSGEEVVLHGDLHHQNIMLDQQAGWIAIDPKGVIGPPCLEVGRFLQNRLSSHRTTAQREALVRERLDIFHSKTGYAKEILAASGLIDCVLSHCWCFEDETINSDWYMGIELAEMLACMADL